MSRTLLLTRTTLRATLPQLTHARLASTVSITKAPLSDISNGTERHYKVPTKAPSAAIVAKAREDDSRIAYEDWVMMHPVYTDEELKSVKVVHHPIGCWQDRVADWIVRFCRFGCNIATRYKHYTPEQIQQAAKSEGKSSFTVQEMRDKGLIMTEEQWLLRTLFLESIAGVPGMVASILRHLRSLRRLKRDGGWIHTLLSEAENERMHLLCFMTVKQPGRFFRFMVLGAQGVFTNGLFLLYLISPKSVHRFVGRLEEEAVATYTNMLEEIEGGRFPEWDTKRAPQIGIDYWRLPEGKQTMKDMIYNIRLDEAGHRHCNHTLANLKPDDFNPFGISEAPPADRGSLPEYTREQALEWSQRTIKEARERHQASLAEQDQHRSPTA